MFRDNGVDATFAVYGETTTYCFLPIFVGGEVVLHWSIHSHEDTSFS